MRSRSFPVHKTKVEGLTKKFDLASLEGRRAYFEAKAGFEISKIREFLKSGTFISYLLGKKNAGKGTYTKLFIEIFGEERIAHVSVGDVVRDAHALLEGEDQALRRYLERNYRGYVSITEAVSGLLGRSASKLLPTELILTLIKWEVDKHPGKSIFIDGFPRSLDQVSYSLFFRELIGHRDDPDFFVLIDVPMAVIDERIKYRVVCPRCHTPRNIKLLATKEVGYDKRRGEFYLKCDNPACHLERMVAKEGDELGIEAIRDRLEADEELIERAFSLHGVPKVLLRNSVPVAEAEKIVDSYEITPEYVFRYDESADKVVVSEKPWIIKDDGGVDSYSLMPPAVVVSMIRQIADILG